MTRKILVIENNAETREMILDCLETEGWWVCEAATGTGGVEQAQKHQPDLVLCALALPDLDGYGVIKVLRQNLATATIPLIFLAANSDPKARRQAMALGADDYIAKPFTTTELLEAIVSKLQYRDLLKQLYTTGLTHLDTAERTLPVQQQEDKPAAKSPPSTSFQFPEHPQLREIFAFIQANYDRPIGLNDIALAFEYSPSYLTSLVRRLTGQTLYQWIVQRRMFEARRLLLESDLLVNKVAEAVGYADTGHFVKHFRKIHNQPPQTWRDAQFR